MAQIAADMIDQLTQQANQLGGAQSDLRAETENATGGQGDELKEQQDQLNQAIEELWRISIRLPGAGEVPGACD